MDIINAGDTAWLLVSSALVLVMTPALAFFYGGMVRKKNILSTLNLSFIMICLISVQWLLYGYSLAFGSDIGGIIGGTNFFGFAGVGAEPPDYAPTVPHMLFAAFQMMFAIITPALITGAFVERVRFKTFLIFSLLWATLIYDPVCHWVWGAGGILGEMGALDFAGGTVVHITAGFSALAFALAIGPARDSARHRSNQVAFPTACWERACCGWGGSVSTVVALWQPTASLCMPCSPPTR